MLAALAALNNLHMRRWDFEAAYLQGELEIGARNSRLQCAAGTRHHR